MELVHCQCLWRSCLMLGAVGACADLELCVVKLTVPLEYPFNLYAKLCPADVCLDNSKIVGRA